MYDTGRSSTDVNIRGAAMIADHQTPAQKPLVIVVECHRAGAISTESTVISQYASLYLASGVAADEIYGVAYMQKPGAAFARVAERLKIDDAEALATTLERALAKQGIPVEIAGMYDD